MTVFFVSRHPGAIDWAKGQGLAVDCWLQHLDIAQVCPGDTVAGTLPVHIAAQVCCQGARYLHLLVDLPAAWRGQELAADQLRAAGARLAEYDVRAKPNPSQGAHATL